MAQRVVTTLAALAAAAPIASQPTTLPARKTPVRAAIPAKVNAMLMIISSAARNRKGSWDFTADLEVDLDASRWKLIATTTCTPMKMIEMLVRKIITKPYSHRSGRFSIRQSTTIKNIRNANTPAFHHSP